MAAQDIPITAPAGYTTGYIDKPVIPLPGPVNKFFDTVMVMDKDENVKNNRLALLVQVKETASMVGDLSAIVL